MDTTTLIIVISLMAVVTYLPRAIPLQINEKYWPKWLNNIVEFLPVAIVAAITIPTLIIYENTVSLLNAQVLAAIPTLLCAYFTKNLMLSVIVGTSFYVLLQVM